MFLSSFGRKSRPEASSSAIGNLDRVLQHRQSRNASLMVTAQQFSTVVLVEDNPEQRGSDLRVHPKGTTIQIAKQQLSRTNVKAPTSQLEVHDYGSGFKAEAPRADEIPRPGLATFGLLTYRATCRPVEHRSGPFKSSKIRPVQQRPGLFASRSALNAGRRSQQPAAAKEQSWDESAASGSRPRVILTTVVPCVAVTHSPKATDLQTDTSVQHERHLGRVPKQTSGSSLKLE